MEATNCRSKHRPFLFLTLALGLSLLGCHDSQSSQQPAPTPAEQQKLKDAQVKTQKEMNTLTSGMGQSLSKTPTAPANDPAAEWKKAHSQKQPSTSKPQTQSQPAAPPSSNTKPQQ